MQRSRSNAAFGVQNTALTRTSTSGRRRPYDGLGGRTDGSNNLKLKCTKGQREELKRLVDIFRARIIDVTDTTYTVELTGASEKIMAFVSSMGSINIIEMVRSGALGISRGKDSLENIK